MSNTTLSELLNKTFNDCINPYMPLEENGRRAQAFSKYSGHKTVIDLEELAARQKGANLEETRAAIGSHDAVSNGVLGDGETVVGISAMEKEHEQAKEKGPDDVTVAVVEVEEEKSESDGMDDIYIIEQGGATKDEFFEALDLVYHQESRGASGRIAIETLTQPLDSHSPAPETFNSLIQKTSGSSSSQSSKFRID